MADKVEKILDIKVNYNEAVKAIAEYQTKIDAARDAEKNLKKQLKDGEISRQQYNEEIAASKIAIADYNDAIRIINKTVQNQIKQEKEQEGSLKALRAELSNLTAEYDALSEAERKGASGEELKNKINEVTDALKGGEEETQRYYRNVGNYEEAIKSAVSSNIPFIGTLIQTQDEMGSVKAGAVAAGAAVKNFSKTLLALLANPIVAILTAISVVIMAVAKGIKSSEENTSRWNAVLAPLKMALDAVGKVLQIVASGILSVVEAGGKMMGWITKQLEKLPVLGKYVAEVNKENERYIAMAKEQAAIDRDTRNLQVQNAKNALQIATLKAKADDELNVSAKERMEAIREANRLEEEASKKNYELAKRRYELMVQQNAMAENTKETNDAIAQAEVEMYNALTEYQDKRGELLGREVSLANEIKSAEKEKSDAAKAASEKAVAIKQKELEAVRAAEDAMLALVKDKREQARKEIELTYSRQIEDLRARLETESDLTVKARQAINDQIKALEQRKSAELQKLSEEELQKEIDNRTKLISLQLEAVKKGSEQEYQLRMQQLLAQRDAELADKELTEQMKLAIVDKYDKQMDDLILQREQEISEKQQEAVRLRMENEIMQLQQSGASELEILQEQASQKLELLNSIQQQEGESEQEFLNRKLQANQEYINAKKAIADKEVEIEQVKFQAIETITSGLSSAFETLGENNKTFAILSKTLALAEIAINTGKALAAGIAQAQSVPFPANLAAIATTVATILSNIAVATKTVKSAKFATGGLVTGPGTGTSDSIPAQLSNGESVMTARATSMFAPLLSSFNQMGGGVPINVTQTSSQALGEDMLARAVAKGVQSMRPVVSVEEITSVGNRVKVLENLGNV
ncbi:hypothetical protein [Phocaeicola plebeius]|jgi:hypothetical protein|uniref:hypothetical protein n=1 Tax=Phocaeicola plebeius TaxID=310297 RepID=UPI0026EE1B10|nr:hypothetical protein [Phocaeicola plebeius]MCI6050057.1 hypothetical protein [Phocaeicola plebeius]MDD6914048.1 hypothetical protein [Phocaeicola plebeius]MDY5979470.1 hypothetical protein [Phocaeicola plebeius]